MQTSDGQLVEAVDPNPKDVYVELEVYDNPNDDDIKVGRYAVAVGGKFSVKTIYAHEPMELSRYQGKIMRGIYEHAGVLV